MPSGLEEILSRVVGEGAAGATIAANRPTAPEARHKLSANRLAVSDRANTASRISRVSERQALNATIHSLAAIKMSRMASDTLLHGVGSQSTKTLSSLRQVNGSMKTFNNQIHNIKNLGNAHS